MQPSTIHLRFVTILCQSFPLPNTISHDLDYHQSTLVLARHPQFYPEIMDSGLSVSCLSSVVILHNSTLFLLTRWRVGIGMHWINAITSRSIESLEAGDSSFF